VLLVTISGCGVNRSCHGLRVHGTQITTATDVRRWDAMARLPALPCSTDYPMVDDSLSSGIALYCLLAYVSSA